MASITPCEHTVWCSALSAEVCGLRHFQLTFYPPITSLARFHPERKPPRRSRPDGNTRFPSGTLLLLEISFAASHDQVPAHRLRTTAQGQAHIHAIRGLHGFTIAIEPTELPAGRLPTAETSVPCIRALDPENSGAWTLLNQGQWTHAADTRDLAAAAPDLIPSSLCMKPNVLKLRRETQERVNVPKRPTLLPLGPS